MPGPTGLRDRPPDVGRIDRYRVADLDEARRVLGRHYYRHRLSCLAPTRDVGMRLTTVSLGHMTIGRLSYDSEVHLGFGELTDAYHVSTPLVGGWEAVWEDRQYLCTPGRIAIHFPVGRTSIARWHSGTVQYGARIDRAYLEQCLSDLLGRPITGPVRFEPIQGSTEGPLAQWLHLFAAIAEGLKEPGGPLYHEAVAERLCHYLVTTLLLGSAHQHSEELHAGSPILQSTAVERVRRAVLADPARAYTVRELAGLAATSVRALQYCFLRHLGVTPMTFVRQTRLAHAHRLLARASRHHTTVAQVATASGFSHLGRFAAYYRDRYGESPSETLASPCPIHRKV
ncbi:AraC family transcriptional regulator [Amycolatopsis jejuensis]|uniref:AraC family transcriptional regulator n=1 Tax=Amycolatopsis jejuensis TaxID=330084 RepID=UPI00068E676A|nr:AraC family transcriptional regulator [Amycolatopsis jejuensis]